MHEIFPVATGVVLGLLLAGVRPARLRAALVLVLGAIAGVVVSATLGELASSWLFAVWDTFQVVACAALTVRVYTLARKRSAVATSGTTAPRD